MEAQKLTLHGIFVYMYTWVRPWFLPITGQNYQILRVTLKSHGSIAIRPRLVFDTIITIIIIALQDWIEGA